MGRTILTGIRANQQLHLGNYLGAIKPMVALQEKLDKGDKFYMFVPDLHSFTTPIDHQKFYKNSIENVRMYLAAGINPDSPQTFIYRQSYIPAHSELAVILANFTYFGETNRMTEFKDKSAQLGHRAVSVGLFTYPILMAADILLYDANYVPVGDDQKQHMELTRILAERFNNKFGPIFTIPADWKEQLSFSSRDYSVRIMSLTNPQNKMSKSISDPRGTILLTENPSKASKKINAATTDSLGTIQSDPQKQSGIFNLLTILSLLNNQSLEGVLAQWEGKESYGELKQAASEAVSSFLEHFQSELAQISLSDAEIILKRGEAQATLIAQTKLEQVKKAIGLRQ